MIHEMHLEQISFNEIDSGSKKVEVRLFDDKRSKIEKGDIIKFLKLPENKKIVEVEVLELHRYKTVKELVEKTPLEYFGSRFENKQQLLEANWIYIQEDIKKRGLLAIYLKKI